MVGNSSSKLDYCIGQLVGLGVKGRGYITYQAIYEVTSKNLDNVTPEAIDCIYQHLKAKHIEIVDKLPDSTVLGSGLVPAKEEPQTGYHQQTKARHKLNKDIPRKTKKTAGEVFLCPEKGIDQLLWHFEKTKGFSEEYFFDIVKRCGYSLREVEELVIYLGTFGVDCPYDYEQWFEDD